MTGEMGTLASYEGGERLFAATLGKVAGAFAEAGHVGYVNLNLIVNEAGIWPARIHLPFLAIRATAVLAPLQRDGWGDLLRRMRDRDSAGFRVIPSWSVGDCADHAAVSPWTRRGRHSG